MKLFKHLLSRFEVVRSKKIFNKNTKFIALRISSFLIVLIMLFGAVIFFKTVRATSYNTPGGMSGNVSLNKSTFSPGEQIVASATGSACSSAGGGSVTATDNNNATFQSIFSGYGAFSGQVYFTASSVGGTYTIWFTENCGGTSTTSVTYSVNGQSGGTGGGAPVVTVWAVGLTGNNISTVDYGTTISIHWASSNGTTSCSSIANNTSVPGSTGASGSYYWSPLVDTVFITTCSNGSSIGSGSTTVKVVPAVTITANPASITTTGGSSVVSWTSQGANSCSSANGGGTGTTGNFTVSPTVATGYSVACTEAPQVTQGSCSGTYTTSASSCTGTVSNSDCGISDGTSCASYGQNACPGTSAPQCHHGCSWTTNNSTISCENLSQSACGSHSTCIWSPGSTVTGDTTTKSVVVPVNTTGGGNPGVVSSFAENGSTSINLTPPGADVTIQWHVSNMDYTYNCDVYKGTSIENQIHLSGPRPVTEIGYYDYITDHASTSTNFYSVKCEKNNNEYNSNNIEALIVTNPVIPNLTPGAITPTTATPGTTVTFTGAIINNGTGSTVDSFSNIFQTATGFDDAYTPLGVKTYAVSGMAPIDAGGSDTFSKSIPLATTDIFIRICADKSSASSAGNITESNEGDNCSTAWTPLVPLSDLVAFPATPTIATAGVPVNLTATIKNQGNGSTGASFMNFFQVSTEDPNGNGSGNGGTVGYVHKSNFVSSLFYKVAEAAGGICGGQTLFNLQATSMPTLAVNATGVTTKSYTFDSDGIYWIRACADKSSPTSNGLITESNESNNCGVWTQVSVGAVPVDGDCGCTPSHYNCGSGTSINQSNGTTSWTWTCQGSQNTTPVGASVSCSELKPPTMTGTLTAENPSCIISKGDSTCNINFSWSTINPQGISAVIKPPYPGTVVGTGNNRNSVSLVVKYNGETFYLYNNQQLLDQKTVSSSCEAGSFWKDGICKEITASPDLTAGRVSPVFVSINEATDFSALITNQGDGSTVNSFSNLFQIADDIDANNNGVNVSDLDPAVSMNPLSANTSKVTKLSYTFTDVSNKYMRVCADKDSAGSLGDITESDETNNCGPWTMISASDQKIDGECSSNIFECNKGNSINNVIGDPQNPSTWDCEGLLGGVTAKCSKDYAACDPGLTNPPTCDVCENGANNPPDCTSECDNGANNPPECTTCANGATNPPICTTECTNGATNYPDCTTCENGATNPPTCTSQCTNGAFNYPDCTICDNGATNPPECTGGCKNGAYNYPFCTTCDNGAVNPPKCTINSTGGCLNGTTNPPICGKKSPNYIER